MERRSLEKKVLAGICAAACLAGLTGCGQKKTGPEITILQSDQVKNAQEQNFGTEQAPEGGRVDAEGRIIDKDGNALISVSPARLKQ